MHYLRWRKYGDPLIGADTRAPFGEPESYFQSVVAHFTGDECLIWPYNKAGDGYGRLRRGSRHERVPRLACEARHGPPPSPRHETAHSCGNGHLGCCNPQHLRWATKVENMADRAAHGRALTGTRNHKAKLSDAQVAEIRALGGTMSQQKIADAFDISQAHVSSILLNKNRLLTAKGP